MSSKRRCIHTYPVVPFIALFILATLTCFAAETRHKDAATRLLETARMRGGLVVHVNTGDGRLTADLRRSNAFVVHGLETDPGRVAAAREHVRGAGLYGPVSIEQWQGPRLPYAADLVNAVVVSRGPATPPDDELLRVLAPGGRVLIQDEDGAKAQSDTVPNGWRVLRKPWPDDIDDWTHYLHGADGNAVARDARAGPPHALQWEAPPKFSRSHEHDTSMPAMVTAAGRVFYIVDDGPPGITDKRLTEKWFLVARDAFSGIQLWQRPIPDWGWPQWDPTRAQGDWSRKRGLRVQLPVTVARRLVTDGDRVFVTLGYEAPVSILDAGTGETLHTCAGSAGTEEILCTDGRLILVAKRNEKRMLLCADSATGALLWQRQPQARYQMSTVAAAEGCAFVVDGTNVICLGLTDGKETWRSPLPARPPGKFRWHPGISLIASDGVLLVLQEESRGKNALEARAIDTGKLLWSAPGGDGYGFLLPPEAYVIDGSVFYFRKPQPELEPWPNKHALDIRTGKPTREVNVPPNLIGPKGHTRCYHARATERYMMLGFRAVEFLDLEGDNHMRGVWLRPACRYGVMPANGLLYVTPNQCQCQIVRTLHNLNALVARRSPEAAPTPAKRLLRGPAFDRPLPSRTPEDADAWPTFRADVRRRGTSRTSVPTQLDTVWQVTIGERPVQPAAAGGRLFIASREDYRLDCLDAVNGKLLWRFTAGGRIDSPPTIHAGRVYVGSADGWVTCLASADGELIWRFQAAPRERRVVSYNRLESAWPVHGSVLVLDSPRDKPVVYFAAGRSSYLDGGIHVYGLDAVSGAQLHHAVVRSPQIDVHNPKAGLRPVAALEDVLTTDGKYIFMRNCTFDRELKLQTPQDLVRKDRQPEQYLSSWAGLLDDNWWNRSFWMAARHWPTHFAHQSPKAGQLLVFDDTTTYTVKCYTRRNIHSPMFFPNTTGYLLMADANANEPYLYRGKPGTPKPIKWLPPVEERTGVAYDKPVTGDPRSTGYTRTAPPMWTQWLPLRIRAMVKTRDRLFVAGAPDILKPDDPLAAFEGRAGGKLRVIDPETGEALRDYDLASPPVFDGLIAAYGRLYLAARDGKLTCMAEPVPGHAGSPPRTPPAKGTP